jgi:hypothetical protein
MMEGYLMDGHTFESKVVYLSRMVENLSRRTSSVQKMMDCWHHRMTF